MQKQNFVQHLKDKRIIATYEILVFVDIISCPVIIFFIVFFPNIPNENQITNIEKNYQLLKKIIF